MKYLHTEQEFFLIFSSFCCNLQPHKDFQYMQFLYASPSFRWLCRTTRRSSLTLRQHISLDSRLSSGFTFSLWMRKTMCTFCGSLCCITLPLSCKIPQSIQKNFHILNQKTRRYILLQLKWQFIFISIYNFSSVGSMQSWKTSMQILSSTTASERSTLDKRSQSFSVEKRFNATNGNATKWSADNHKPDAANGEFIECCNKMNAGWKYIHQS